MTPHNFSQFCSTYPSVLLTPAKISDTTLTYAVKYRSKGRLPIGTYVHWANGVNFLFFSPSITFPHV